MKTIAIDSPQAIQFPDESLQCKISHQLYIDTAVGVKLPVNFSAFMVLQEKDANGKFIMPIDTTLFSKETVYKLKEIKARIGECSQIAEVLFGLLKAVNNKLKQLPEFEDIFSKYEEGYYKLDFMGHRNLLSEILKSGLHKELTHSIREYDLKSVTKSFYNFIMDRNKYTHGELMWWYPNKETLLEYENDAREKECGIVNADIMNSFLKCYKDLSDFLHIIDGVISK